MDMSPGGGRREGRVSRPGAPEAPEALEAPEVHEAHEAPEARPTMTGPAGAGEAEPGADAREARGEEPRGRSLPPAVRRLRHIVWSMMLLWLVLVVLAVVLIRVL
jgi:hypothetical protein